MAGEGETADLHALGALGSLLTPTAAAASSSLSVLAGVLQRCGGR